MLHKIILIALGFLTLNLVQAQNIQVNSDSPDEYVVVKGDTLWDIAGEFLSEPWRWPEIWEVNPQIQDPHLIYPGDIVSLSYRDGLPVLTVDRGGLASTSANRSISGRNVKITPSVREHERDEAIHTIPIDVIRHFLERPLVINNDDEMDSWPYVLSSPQQRLISGQGNRVYVMGISQGSGEDSYAIYRKGKAYEKNGEILGYEAIHIGDAVVERHGSPATLVITDSTREIMKGDRLLAQSRDDISIDFMPNPVTNAVDGSIISIVDGLKNTGDRQIVVVDVGKNDGIDVGDVLGIYQDGGIVMDKEGATSQLPIILNEGYTNWIGSPKAKGDPVNLPNEYAGVVMIFRTYNRVSYGLIMEAYVPLSVNDMVSNL